METLTPGEADLLESLPFGVALIGPDGTIAWRTGKFVALLGATEVPVGTRLAELPALGPAPELQALLREGHEPRRRTQVRVGPSLPGQPERRLDVMAEPWKGTGSGGWLLTVQEIALESEEARGRFFYESFLTSSNAMEVADRQGILIDVNPAFERIYGYSRAECIGRRPNLVRSRHTRPEIYERMWADLLDPNVGHWSGEIMNRDRRGHERPVLLTITAVKNERDETTHYVGVAVDLSERRRWEQSSAHADRLASLGQLAAGVAHEINTPLANVMLVAESLRRRSTDPWVRSRVDTITDQVEVAARIVRGLLDFARRSEPRFVGIDLADVVRDSIEFVRGKQSSDVEIEATFGTEPLPIQADRGQLIQVLTNLLNNAYEAISGPGQITVSVRRDLDDALVEIVDSGPGVPVEVLPHLFEPFFTTKAEGKGTGLGLAICHGIVQLHHGTIEVDNAPTGGARFRVRVPRSGPAEARSKL